MAQVLIITSETVRDGLQYLGDIVGVYSDSHVFSSTELEKFSVLTISGSVADVTARLNQIKPVVLSAYQFESDGDYHWTDPDYETIINTIKVFRVEGDRKWYQLVNAFKFPISISSLTPEEKQLLETIDINNPSVDSFIRKIIKDVTVLSGNNIEIRELRGTHPSD